MNRVEVKEASSSYPSIIDRVQTLRNEWEEQQKALGERIVMATRRLKAAVTGYKKLQGIEVSWERKSRQHQVELPSGNTVFDEVGISRLILSVSPTEQELETAPDIVRMILHELNLKGGQFSLMVKVDDIGNNYPYEEISNFDIVFKPIELTENVAGIRLEGRGGYPDFEVFGTTKIYVGINYEKDRRLSGQASRASRRLGEIHSLERYLKRPLLTNIVVDTADWLVEILNRRSTARK